MSAINPIITAIRAVFANNSQENIYKLADAAGLKIVKPLSPDDIKQIDKTLILPENATKGDRKRAIKNWLRPFLGKHIKTSDGKVVVVNSADSMWHLSYNGNRNDLKAKVVPYVFDVLAFGDFIEREDLSHERKDDFIAFHVYRKWCEVEGKQVYLEAHAGERENGVIELVVYNQKLAIKKNEGSLGTLKSSNEDQVPKYALDNHNNTIFDDVQVSDDLTVEDGDLVRILEVKEVDNSLMRPKFMMANKTSVHEARKTESPEIEEIAELYAKELGRGNANKFHIDFAKAVLAKDAYALEYLANGSNDVGKKIFTKVTGILLPKQQKETWKALLAWGGISEQKEAFRLANKDVEYEVKRFMRENGVDENVVESLKASIAKKIAEGFTEIINSGGKYWLVNREVGGIDLSAKPKKGVIGLSKARLLIDAMIKAENARQALDAQNRLDDIGGFNFTPVIDLDQTLKAIKETLFTNGSHDNIKRLATLAGLTLKEPEPDVDLDMFGEPINQDFDLFGDPIQDGEESPVEELPRLAVVELPLNKLTLSEDVPQFKSGAESDTGVVEALGGKFDRTGVAPIQVWERTDGRLEIISGRHRTDLARRSGEKTIPAQVHKESEGFTAKQAMMLDAELNIRDGQGKVKDYVDYFTHSEISEDEAERRGLIARSIGQRAFTIASKGSDELKTLHRNEIISDQAAAEISAIAPNNSAMQAVGLRVLQEHKPLNNALNTIRAVQALTREKGQEPDTFDLFGFDDSALKEAEAMARIASRKQRQIAEQLNAIKGAVKNPKLAAKHGVVVENEADALAKVQTMSAQKARWDNWSSHADLLAEVRKELNDKLDSLDDEDDYYWFCQEELAA